MIDIGIEVLPTFWNSFRNHKDQFIQSATLLMLSNLVRRYNGHNKRGLMRSKVSGQKWNLTFGV